MQISKRESLAIKKVRKEGEFGRRERKDSTQLSLFTWLQKGPSQQSTMYASSSPDYN